ncbi:hypothetical protein A9Q99_06715 [Gammaproteobacteria bacterium 45_16_T64]|nr:hypothetical protein A9Q99_06715 [Gammaproteobacteria bacterium 45_16_T64]
MSILIISDSTPDRELISAILSVNYPVYSAKSAMSGIELAHQLMPETIVIDVHNDEFDGFSILQSLKQRHDTKSIPVILLGRECAITANTVRGLKLGAFDCLASPIDDALLSIKVDAAVHIRRQELALIQSKELAKENHPDILIADDAQEMIMLLDRTLTDAGFKVISATSGNQAIALAQEFQPQLILLDVLMPGLNGFDTCRRLKSNPNTEAIPVVFVTSEDLSSAEEEGFNAGGVDYITKPINVPLLVARVKIHMQLKMYQDSLESVVKQRTKALRKSLEKLSHSNQVKDDFLTIINHELRTPLNGAQGALYLLQHTDQPPSEQRELLSTADRSIADLCNLVENILILTEAIAGTLKLESQSFSLTKLIASIEKQGIESAQNKALELTTNIDCSLGDTFLGDPAQLARIMWHLVDNAIKFSHHGSINITTSLAYHPHHPELLNFTFVITDQGIGIDEDKLQLIFQLFQQLESNAARKFGGLGVGLPFCRALLFLMNGEINVSSEEDHGTTVTFEIPLRKCEHSISHRDIASVTADTAQKTILIVEDNPVNQLVERKFAEKYGLAVVVAANGEEAIVALENEHIDIILMDCQMPIMDGFEATKIIRQSRDNTKGLPIIAVTANSTTLDRTMCHEAGMDDYIPKPIDFDELTIKLNYWLAQRK